MASDGQKCYTYNQANQLTQVRNCSNNQLIAEYVYDYQGERIEKKEYTNGSLQQTVYTPTKEYETKKQASNSATANTTYYYANDELVARKNPDGTNTYYQNDHLNSTSLLTDQNGNVLENTSYYPFGEVRTGGTQSKYLYTGKEKDQESGLSYYDSRYYSSKMQRFIQPDTLLPNVYDPQQLDRYSYVRNNPLRYTDPSGHNPILLELGLFGLAVIAAIVFTPAILPHNTPATRNINPPQAIDNIYHNTKNLVNKGKTLVSNTIQSTLNSSQNNKQKNDNLGNKAEQNRPNESDINFRSNEKLTAEQRLEGHFSTHGERLGYSSSEEYLEGARKLYRAGDGVEAIMRPNGDELYFRPSTGEFGVVDNTGIIKTYMKPDNPPEYWADELSKFVK